MQYGFIPDKIKPEDYIFGSGKVVSDILQADGQWDSYLPDREYQEKNGLETMACTSFGTLNCLEALFKRKYQLLPNFSDRYSAIMSGTTKNGNSPQKVIETIRNFSGCVPEVDLPFNVDTWDAFYAPVDFSLKLKGVGWLSNWVIKHEWVFQTQDIEEQQQALMDALTLSPVGIGVQAWTEGKDYYERIDFDNHWVMLYGYEKGEYWKVFDHYDMIRKKLAWDYSFSIAKRYHIEPRQGWDAQFVIRAARGIIGAY